MMSIIIIIIDDYTCRCGDHWYENMSRGSLGGRGLYAHSWLGVSSFVYSNCGDRKMVYAILGLEFEDE